MGRPRKLRFPVGLFIWLKLSSNGLVKKGGIGDELYDLYDRRRTPHHRGRRWFLLNSRSTWISSLHYDRSACGDRDDRQGHGENLRPTRAALTAVSSEKCDIFSFFWGTVSCSLPAAQSQARRPQYAGRPKVGSDTKFRSRTDFLD